MNDFKRALLIALSSLLIFAVLWFNWNVCANLWIFPNDIIGTYYETPLPNHNRLTVEVLGHGRIADRDDETVVDGIRELQVVGDYVVGRDSTQYFSLNTLTQEVCYFASENQMTDSLGIDLRPLSESIEFYWQHREPYDILANIVIAMFSLGLAVYITRQRKSNRPAIVHMASTLVWGILGCYVTIVESIRLLSLLHREDAHSFVLDWHIFFLVCGVLVILVTVLRWSRKRWMGKAVNVFLLLFALLFTLAVAVSSFDDGHWRMIDLFVLEPLSVLGFLLTIISIGIDSSQKLQNAKTPEESV